MSDPTEPTAISRPTAGMTPKQGEALIETSAQKVAPPPPQPRPGVSGDVGIKFAAPLELNKAVIAMAPVTSNQVGSAQGRPDRPPTPQL